jgi:hypothetical protein
VDSTVTADTPLVVRHLLEPGRYRLRIALPDHEPFETDVDIIAMKIVNVIAEMALRP